MSSDLENAGEFGSVFTEDTSNTGNIDTNTLSISINSDSNSSNGSISNETLNTDGSIIEEPQSLIANPNRRRRRMSVNAVNENGTISEQSSFYNIYR